MREGRKKKKDSNIKFQTWIKFIKKFALKCVLIVLAISLVINIRIGFLFNIQVNDMNIPYCDVPEENSHEYFIIT